MSNASSATLLADRAVLRVGGDDPRDFLQGLVTQDTASVTPDTPHWSGLLTPQGKALFDFILWDGGDGALLLDCEAAQADALARRLTIYRLRRAITIERTDLRVHWSPGPGRGIPDPRLADLGWRWLDPSDTPPATEWLATRLRHGVPEGSAELGQDQTLWLECNARELNGVSFTKGCYVGQENTARMHHRAKVNRRLVVAPLGDDNRARARYPELGLMITHRRVEALGDAVRPAWLQTALEQY